MSRLGTIFLSIFLISGASLAKGLENNSLPQNDPADTTVWPNQTSRANSDSWIVQNHDRIRKMAPRVLIVNFSNEATNDHIAKMIEQLTRALAESSRYHGYTNSSAPVFLDYQLFKFIDLRDKTNTKGNSEWTPIKKGMTNGFNMDYQQFFSEKFSEAYAVKDPKNESRFLRLDELIEQGFVHELWFILETVPNLAAYECVEEKPVYDENFVRQGNRFVQAGNGGDSDQKWTGRSIRIGCINPTRGIGCFMESLSHSFEGMAKSKAIPYFTKYFIEFAGFDLKARYKLPVNSFYPLWGEGNGIEYPNPSTAVIKRKNEQIIVTNYIAFGGNVHFPPNGRSHYDLANTNAVLSTIEDWRIGSGEGGRDIALPWTNERFAKYNRLAQDCMGPWLIYWRQNVPGLDNKQKDDSGKPMRNWWPFLFY